MSQYIKTFHAIEIGGGGDGRWAAHVRPAVVGAEGWLTAVVVFPACADVVFG